LGENDRRSATTGALGSGCNQQQPKPNELAIGVNYMNNSGSSVPSVSSLRTDVPCMLEWGLDLWLSIVT
jgi:hypothetical protein